MITRTNNTKIKTKYGIYGAGVMLAIPITAVQAVEMPSIIGSHMVMQRD
jgi:hypothetical protein